MKALAFATAVALATAALALSATPSFADDDPAVSWSVSPAGPEGADGRSWVELELDPGASTTEYLSVRNLGATATTFTLTAADGYFTKTGRFNMLQSDQESVDAGTWITVDETVTVDAGGVAVIPFTISVPENATPGDHAAGIAASVSTTGTTEDGAKVGVESRVGFRVITQVTGELAPAMALSEVTGEYSPSWNLFTPGELTITYTATNVGNTQLSFGETAGDATTARGDVFPGEKRSVTVDSVPAWPLGLVSVDVRVDSSVPSDDSLAVAPVTRTVQVVAVPWLHLLVLVGLAVVVVMIILGRRRSAARIELLLEQARAEGREQAGVTG
jgi:hypothetical protein